MSGRALLYTKRHPYDICIVSSHIGHSGHRKPIINVPDHVRIKRAERD